MSHLQLFMVLSFSKIVFCNVFLFFQLFFILCSYALHVDAASGHSAATVRHSTCIKPLLGTCMLYRTDKLLSNYAISSSISNYEAQYLSIFFKFNFLYLAETSLHPFFKLPLQSTVCLNNFYTFIYLLPFHGIHVYIQ